MTTIHERRFRLELWTSNDKFDGRGVFVCEIQSCQLNFTISTIPSATIKPLFGTIMDDGSVGHRYTSFDQLLDYAQERKAVQLYLYTTQSFTSDTNNAESKEWEFKAQGEPDRYGQYRGFSTVIFEGFLCPSTVELTDNSAGIVLTIQHWLCSLANVSLLTTACHTSTPSELAIQCYNNIEVLKSNEKAQWDFINAKLNLVENPNGLWKHGIKETFTTVLESESTLTYNDFIDTQKDRARHAIEQIDGSRLILKDTGTFGENLSSLITEFLSKETFPSFVQTNAWDRLLYYGNSFLFIIIPRVHDALLVPVPCTTDPSNVIHLKEKDILRITASPLSTVQLSRLICTPSTMTNRASGDTGGECHYEISKYPDVKNKDLPDGFIQAISYPEWIMLTSHALLPGEGEAATVFSDNDDLSTAQHTATETATKIENQAKEIQDFLGGYFVKASYLTQAFNTTWATIALPFRMDLCLGESVCCDINEGTSTELHVYGVITGMTITVSSSDLSSTQLSLSFVRTHKNIKNKLTNPYTDNVGYYTKLWDGKDESGTKWMKLYD